MKIEVANNEIFDKMKDGVFQGFDGYEYKQTESIKSGVKQRIIVHLYPIRDKNDSDDIPEDSLMNKAIVYDVTEREYCIEENIGKINMLGAYGDVRIFKDGSTCISIDMCIIERLGQELIIKRATDR